MKHTSALLLLSSSLCSGALEYPNDLAQWVVTCPPERWDDRWWVAACDHEHEWFVFLRAGVPSARLASVKDPAPSPLPFAIEENFQEGLAGRRLNVKADDGWIVSFNRGEFGATLWWFSPDGTRRDKISSMEWINSFLFTDTGLLALEGISHGFGSNGRIIRLSPGVDGRWHSKTLVPLNEEPHVAVKDVDGSLIVATHNRLVRVHPASKKVEVLLRDVFWSGLYPNSMVLTPQGTVYLGMRHGVAKVEQRDRTYRVEWLLPIREFDRMIRIPETVARKGSSSRVFASALLSL
jgi:hypothetical protein